MKLYYTTGACSLAPHITLSEGGFKYDIERVDLKSKKTETGKDYNTISEKSAVPLLVLDNGETLSEGSVIMQYLADQKPELNLAPKNGTMERVRLQEWLNYISTDVHKAHYVFFHPDAGQQARDIFMDKIKKAYTYIAGKLKGKQYLTGEQFTIADAYLFTVLNWSNSIKLDLSQWPELVEYKKRVAARPKVQEAMRAEGLLDKKAA